MHGEEGGIQYGGVRNEREGMWQMVNVDVPQMVS